MSLPFQWDDGPEAGAWIASRLGPFGAALGHAVPLGYEGYAIVPIPWDEDEDDDAESPSITVTDALLDVLAPVTGDQPVHCGLWDGWGWLADAGEQIAAHQLERPAADPLELPHRRYHLWSGPLRSVLALRDDGAAPPSLIWPEDRSWFVGVPIYTNEIAVGGGAELIEAILADPRLAARRGSPDDLLDHDD
ncbi:hypothetical protein [Solirubrobacter soli]|uniref:hypothetical protein n=1 Tax=Solirubrobacter soli TaxID=363832 RepID=UPI0004070879|nr:hypothetical protein [Solirubrobacter soli]